jgi:2-keto-4-pentenoate hydratase/2-oxohepta-3-ene-1,7-dioic acid hydratase in catechol pathway
MHKNLIGLIEGNIFGEYMRLEADIPIEKVSILSPVQPGKIICMARNYIDHARERDVEIPETPMIFLKPPSAVIPAGTDIILPPQSEHVDHEAELAVVIGKTGRWLDSETIKDHIMGYTIANDVTARDLQKNDGQWTRAKGFDTFCPMGPWIETELEPSDVLITCRVNGELRQMASTKEMIFSIQQIVAYISSVMTLNPGDVILTGTPAGVGVLEAGDDVEIEIEGIGVLRNSVK